MELVLGDCGCIVWFRPMLQFDTFAVCQIATREKYWRYSRHHSLNELFLCYVKALS